MNKRPKNARPFYVGQPADHVRVVAHRTNRRRTAVEFVCASGEYRLELKRDRPKIVDEWMARQTFKPATVTEVRNFYPGCTLIMRRSRGMFRVAEIISEGQNDD